MTRGLLTKRGRLWATCTAADVQKSNGTSAAASLTVDSLRTSADEFQETGGAESFSYCLTHSFSLQWYLSVLTRRRSKMIIEPAGETGFFRGDRRTPIRSTSRAFGGPGATILGGETVTRQPVTSMAFDQGRDLGIQGANNPSGKSHSSFLQLPRSVLSWRGGLSMTEGLISDIIVKLEEKRLQAPAVPSAHLRQHKNWGCPFFKTASRISAIVTLVLELMTLLFRG